VVTNYHTLDSV